MSLIFFAILVIDFSQSDFFKKQHPKLTDRVYDNKGASLELTKVNFGLNLWIIDKDWYYAPYDPSYISLEVSQMIYNYQTGLYTPNNFTLENCTEEIFENGFCIKNNTSIFLNLTNETWSGEYSYLKIAMKFCNNNTFNNNCKSVDEIKEYVDRKTFRIDFSEYRIDMLNYYHPTNIEKQNTKDFFINKNMSQTFITSFLQIDLYNSENLIFDSKELIKTIYQIDNIPINTFYEWGNDEDRLPEINNGNDAFFKFLIYPNPNKREIVRKYMTLLEAFSSLGGLASFLNFFAIFISKFTIKAKIIRKISKKINPKNKDDKIIEKMPDLGVSLEHNPLKINETSFQNSIEMSFRNQKDLNIENHNPYPQKNITNNLQEKKSPQYENNLESKPKNNTDKNIIEVSLESMHKKKSKKITLWDYIKYNIRKLMHIQMSLKDLLIKETEEYFLKNFEVDNLLQKILDIDKLKCLLMDKSQLEIFDSIKNFSPQKDKKEKNDSYSINLADKGESIMSLTFTNRLKLMIN